MTINATRQQILNQAWWGIAHTLEIHYAQTRPIPLAQYKDRKLPITTDCSGYVTCCYYAAGAADPNGNGYNGQGYTGTMLDTLQVTTDPRPGDLIVFGSFPGDHVCIILELGEDPLLASHGGEIGPIDILLSDERQYHVGQPITYLRGVDKVARKPGKRRYKVSGNEGSVISHAVGTLRWEIKHRRQKRREANKHLHFDIIEEADPKAANDPTHEEKKP